MMKTTATKSTTLVSRVEWFERERPLERVQLGVPEKEYRLWKIRHAAWAALKCDQHFEPSGDKKLVDYLGGFQQAEANWEAENLLLLAGMGNGEAEREVASLAIRLTEFLEGLRKPRRPVRDFAAQQLFWPALQTPFRGLVAGHPKMAWPVGHKLLEGFTGLGQQIAALKERTRGTRGSGPGIARRWALLLLLEVEAARQNQISVTDEFVARFLNRPIPEWRRKAVALKQLATDEQMAANWIEVCRLLFKEKTGGRPERIPELAALAKKFRGKRFRLNGRVTAEMSDRRAFIWGRIRESIQTFAGVHRAQKRKASRGAA